MASTTFNTYPIYLEQLLKQCASGDIQLPDFQRSWVWDEDRIKSLIASISQAFPVGALMTLQTRSGAAETFKRRPVEGAPERAKDTVPQQLLLDGQQRMTSLYQTCLRREVVETVTAKQRRVRRWFYIDIRAALSPDIPREEAIVGVPEDRIEKSDFDRRVVRDLSSAEREFAELMFPLNRVFDWSDWMMGFWTYWSERGRIDMHETFKTFRERVLTHFQSYQVPVIALAQETTHEAVCLVFEKVNTGGKPLDAFELVTAMYAAKGHLLRDDWFGNPDRPKEPGLQYRLQICGRAANQTYGVLEKIAPTEVLQAIALLHTTEMRDRALTDGKRDAELPGVRATRQSLLDLPLEAYIKYRDVVEEGFKRVVQFLWQKHIFKEIELPYQGQLVPFAAILARIGDKWHNLTVKEKLSRWFWCGIFGELYGAGSEARFARDIVEVPLWLDGGPEPSTVRDGVFRAGRLDVMRTRKSAAYKGVHALLMAEGARDFRTGHTFSQTLFFDEYVDIHHIFPQDWCLKQGKEPREFDSVLNKTPLCYRTNRIIGGAAPSKYLAKLEAGGKDAPPLDGALLDECLRSHALDPELLRRDLFEAFIADRRNRLLALISKATGHRLFETALSGDDGVDVGDSDINPAEMTLVRAAE